MDIKDAPQIELIDDEDFKILTQWLAARNQPKIPRGLLPAMSIMLSEDGVQKAFCAVYLDNSVNVAMLSWITTNPELSPRQSFHATELIISAAENLCKIHGYRIIFAHTGRRSVGKFLSRQGYSPIDKSAWNLLKTLTYGT